MNGRGSQQDRRGCWVGGPLKPSGHRRTCEGKGPEGTPGRYGSPRFTSVKAAFICQCNNGGSDWAVCDWDSSLSLAFWVPELCTERCSGEKASIQGLAWLRFSQGPPLPICFMVQGFPHCLSFCFWDSECFSVSSRALNSLA